MYSIGAETFCCSIIRRLFLFLIMGDVTYKKCKHLHIIFMEVFFCNYWITGEKVKKKEKNWTAFSDSRVSTSINSSQVRKETHSSHRWHFLTFSRRYECNKASPKPIATILARMNRSGSATSRRRSHIWFNRKHKYIFYLCWKLKHTRAQRRAKLYILKQFSETSWQISCKAMERYVTT